MYQGQTVDLTNNNLTYRRAVSTFRAVAALTFTPGLLVQVAAIDKQVYPDVATVQLPAITAGQTKLCGFVADTWPGFAGSIGAASYVSPTVSNTSRGTSGVDVVLRGFHPAIFIDQSGAGAATVTDGIPLIASRATAGYVQGVAVATGTMDNLAATAALPSTGFGSSLTAASLAQATATQTLTGTPAAGDTISFTNTSQFTTANPGVGQTITFTSPPLTTAQAVSVTTAAAAFVAYLNAQPAYSQYMTATNSAGVITHTINALANPFLVTFGTGTTLAGQATVAVSGMVVNNAASGGWAFTTTTTGGTVSTATTQWVGGTGYKGTIGAYVAPQAY